MIEHQWTRGFIKYTKCLSYHHFLLCNSNIFSFLNSRDSANHDKVDGLSPDERRLKLYRISFFGTQPTNYLYYQVILI